MNIYIIGYPWCPHFQNALNQLETFFPKKTHPILIPLDLPNRIRMLQEIKNIIGSKKQIYNYALTSPQIIVENNNNMVCIPGEDALMHVGPENVEEYCTRAYFHTLVR